MLGVNSSLGFICSTWYLSRGQQKANGPLLGLFYRSQLKSDQPTTGGGGRLVKERLPRALPWLSNASHATLVASSALIEGFSSDRRRRGVVEGCN